MLHLSYDSGTTEVLRDPAVCLCSFCCTPYQNALTHARLENRSMTVCDCVTSICPLPPVAPFPCCMAYQNRQQLRAKYGFPSEPFADALKALLFPCCVVAQDGRETKLRESVVARKRYDRADPMAQEMDNVVMQ
eukprot:TRINITY_DN33645_c0_g1_i1.p1 TRINITY_DN33645_c0_g1~~TRINITY_DN33645_c0_g1_i1.p1  ORF type:complete len:134 (+),score=28.52 TRINITY_DN33645_c0_g1_i1:134-535(+)